MTEKQIIKAVQKMCEESLSPDVFEKWECVKHWLEKSRKKLNKNARQKEKGKIS